MKNLFVCLSVAILFSCNNVTVENQMKQIDSLKSICDSVKIQFSEFNIDSIKIWKTIIEENTNILNSLQIDYEKEIALKESVFNFSRAFKSFKAFSGSYPELKEGIEYSTEQLGNLERDVKNDVISEDDFKKYFKDESEALSSLKTEFNFYYRDVPFCIQLFKKEYPVIKNYLDNKKTAITVVK